VIETGSVFLSHCLQWWRPGTSSTVFCSFSTQ